MNEFVVLQDYEIEQWIRSGQARTHKQNSLHWQQLGQYAVNHTLYRWHSTPAEARRRELIHEWLDEYWTNKIDAFGSRERYDFVKHVTAAHLTGALLNDSCPLPPIFLFDKINVQIEELGVGLSVIFQTIQGEGSKFAIRKYVIEESPAILEAFRHIMVAFCYKAFGALPETIEMFRLLAGEKHTYRPKTGDISQAFDYIRLVKETYAHDHASDQPSLAPASLLQ